MKIVALTMPSVGVRYRAQIQTLVALGIDIHCVEVRGFGLQLERFKRQFRILRRLGYKNYADRRAARAAATPLKEHLEQQVEAELRLRGSVFEKNPDIVRVFPGFGSELLKYLHAQKPDFVFQLGTGLLPSAFVKRSCPLLNVHPGILPGIRGMEPVFWAHYYGREDWLGTTLHLIDEGIDTGKPLLRRKVPYLSGNTMVNSLALQVIEECEMLRLFFSTHPKTLELYDAGGSTVSAYRSQWSVEQFKQLEAGGWWGVAQV